MVKKLFIPMESCPDKNNKWFIRKEGGGYSPCILGSPLLGTQSVLSNCVGFAWGRFSMLHDKSTTIGFNGTDYPLNAHYWYTADDGYQRGQTPKLGAVACWKRKDGKLGHVACVEQVNENGSWWSAESAYKGKAFRRVYYSKNSYKNGFIFQGFIYPEYEFVTDLDELKIGDKVKITAKGNSRADGKGYKSGGVGWTRYVLNILSGSAYPYQIGAYSGTRKITTGFYKASALERVQK